MQSAQRLASAVVCSLLMATATCGAALAHDGETSNGPLAWSAIEGPPGSGSLWDDIAVGGSGAVVAVDGAAPRTLWHSADLENWSSSQLSGKKTDALVDVVAVPGGFLALGTRTPFSDSGQSTLFWRSVDGREWAGPEVLDGPRFDAAATVDGTVILAGLTGKRGDRVVVWRSSDGVEWTASAANDPGTHFAVERIASAPDGSVIVSTRDPAKKWNVRRLHTLAADGSWSSAKAPFAKGWDITNPRAIVSTPDGWLISLAQYREKGDRAGGVIARSVDGIDWQALIETKGYLADIVATADGYVALPDPLDGNAVVGHYWTSQDGASWTEWTAEILDQRIAQATLLPDGRVLAIGTPDDPAGTATFFVGESVGGSGGATDVGTEETTSTPSDAPEASGE